MTLLQKWGEKLQRSALARILKKKGVRWFVQLNTMARQNYWAAAYKLKVVLEYSG